MTEYPFSTRCNSCDKLILGEIDDECWAIILDCKDCMFYQCVVMTPELKRKYFKDKK